MSMWPFAMIGCFVALQLTIPNSALGRQQTRSVRTRTAKRAASDKARFRLESDRFHRMHNVRNKACAPISRATMAYGYTTPATSLPWRPHRADPRQLAVLLPLAEIER